MATVKPTKTSVSVVRTLATSKPSWLRPFPKVKPRKGDPPLVGEVLPDLFRVGFPHLRFVDERTVADPSQATEDIFVRWWTCDPIVRPRSVWSRFVRAYAGSVSTLSSDPRKRSLTKEAKAALRSSEPIDAAEVPELVRRLMTVPASLRSRERTEDFIYALEAMCGSECVSDAIVDVLEKPPPGRAMPQMKAVVDNVALALGFVRARLEARKQKELDQQLRKVLESKSKRYPIPQLRLKAFLDTARAPKGTLTAGGAHVVPDVLHTTNKAQILATISAFLPPNEPLFLLDPRLVFLAGEEAIPIYLSKFVEYERALHPTVAAIQLGAFVDAIAPFRHPEVVTWLDKLVKHRLVGGDGKAWLELHR